MTSSLSSNIKTNSNPTYEIPTLEINYYGLNILFDCRMKVTGI